MKQNKKIRVVVSTGRGVIKYSLLEIKEKEISVVTPTENTLLLISNAFPPSSLTCTPTIITIITTITTITTATMLIMMRT